MTKENSKQLDGRVALVTGASRGIGAAVAKTYAREGAHVVLLARDIKKLEEVDDAIRSEGGSASLLPFDLSKTDLIANIAPTVAQRFGRLDILVGNAAMLGQLSPVAHSDPANWEQVFRLNFLANYALIRAFDPFLRGSDAGRAVFVSSGAVQSTRPFWGAYSASKAALEALVATYAKEVEHSPLKVNLIDPGRTRTAMRAAAAPAEDPMSIPAPEEIMESFIELVLPAYEGTGQVVKAKKKAA